MAMNPDVNNNEQFLEWVLENHSLEDACRVVPNLEVELFAYFLLRKKEHK